MMVRYLEEFGETRLTDVQTYDYHLLVKQCETYGKVGCGERLALTGSSRREHDGVLSLLEHKLDVGTYGTEHLLHEVVLVGVHHDVSLCLCLVAGNSHVADDGQFGKRGNVVMSLNLVTEELDEEEDACGDGKTEDESDEHNH